MRSILILAAITSLISISCAPEQEKSQEAKDSMTIAFGSCSKQNLTDKQLWTEVINENPDLWIWLGDNIYGDTENMILMKEKYDLQKSHPDYQRLMNATEIIGIWDDHDFGANDAGKEYPKKDEAKELLFDFLDVAEDNPSRNRQGTYQSYDYAIEGKKVKVILLDGRYFRDSLKWERNPKKALINENGDLLGEEQWTWFESQLDDTTTDLFLVGCGIQFLTTDHNCEKWSNFPKDRERLLSLIQEKVEKPLILLSGDRHISEVSKIDLPEYDFPLYDITSSSLTSPWSERNDSENTIREGKITYDENFAVLEIAWINDALETNFKFVGKDNKTLQEFEIRF